MTISNNTATTSTINLAAASLGAEVATTNTTADPELVAWLKTAREWCETFTHRAFITQTWDDKRGAFPACQVLELPKAPLISVTSVGYVDTAGVAQTWSAALYTVDAPAGPKACAGQIVPVFGESFPVTRGVINAVTIRFVAGYGAAAAVPASIKTAMKLLIAHWYEHRESVNVGNISSEIPLGVTALLWPYKSF